MTYSSHFAQTYIEARRKFLDAAAAAQLAVTSHLHPLKGRDGEELATDVVRVGSADAKRLLILSSACHGVEGFCGSGVQVALLKDAKKLDQIASSGTGVLIMHALNPHGFSFWRRVTNEVVDLNRNFHDFSRALPENLEYAELDALLLPPEWPPANNDAAVRSYLAKNGLPKFQAVVSRGQHSHPQGLFFGGTAPTWSNQTVRKLLREHAHATTHLGWIDLHTGLGPSGYGERIHAGREDAAALVRARAWWGGDGRTPVTSIYDGTSVSAKLTGMMATSVYDECPQAEYTGIAMEYGTVPVLEVMDAMRGDHWLHLHQNAPAEQALAIKQRVRDAFYTDTEIWKQQIVEQGLETVEQGLAGLRSR